MEKKYFVLLLLFLFCDWIVRFHLFACFERVSLSYYAAQAGLEQRLLPRVEGTHYQARPISWFLSVAL